MATEVLPLLSKFENVRDHESGRAYFRTQLFWVGSHAYLNVIFKPPPRDVLAETAQRLKMPPSLTEFLGVQNGVNLFSGSLVVYGIHQPGQMLTRAEPFFDLPFNIEDENDSWPPPDPGKFLVIGAYGLDGTGVCINRVNSYIYAFKRGEDRFLPSPMRSWHSLDEWITSEIARLAFLFDAAGKRLVDELQLLPVADRPS